MSDPARFQPDPPLDNLLAPLCAGDLTPEQARELIQLLETDERARELYVLHLNLHGELMWRLNAARTAAEVPAKTLPLLPAKPRRFPLSARIAGILRVDPGRWIT